MKTISILMAGVSASLALALLAAGLGLQVQVQAQTPEESPSQTKGAAVIPADAARKVTSPLAPEKSMLVLEEVASFPKQQVTGVTVANNGRLFVCFPHWSDDHTISVAEVVNGELKPYPDESWNGKTGPMSQRWICVQSVLADDNGSLWVLDAASPKMEGVLPGGAKLVEFEIATGRIEQTIIFDSSAVPEKGYLNDLRVDTTTGHAFLTESGEGALLVINFKTGKVRRVLGGHPSVHAEPKATLVVDGDKVIDSSSGRQPMIHVDGIAYDKKEGWVYFHALTGETLYRIKAEALRDESLSEEDLVKQVKRLGATPKPDGMVEGRDGSVYLTAIEKNAVVRYDVASKKTTMLMQDARLQWPDSICWGNDGKLYVTASQIHRMPRFHDGESKWQGPFKVYRFAPP